MKKLVVVTIFALVFVSTIAAARPNRHHSHVRVLSLSIASGTTTVSGSPVPVQSVCWVSFNGKSPQMAWADSPHVLEYAWHGVVAVVAASDSALTLKVASVPRKPVYVYARCSW